MASASSSWSWSPWGWWSSSTPIVPPDSQASAVIQIPTPPPPMLNAARNAPPHLVTSQQIKQAMLQKTTVSSKNVNHVSQNDVTAVLAKLKKIEIPQRKTVFEPRSPVLRELLNATAHRRVKENIV